MDSSSAAAAIGRMTRWMQARSKRRAIGLFYLARVLDRLFPHFAGIIKLENGLRFYVDTSAGKVEHFLFHIGSWQLGLTYHLEQRIPRGAYCIDAGANIGFFTLLMAHLAGAEGQVAAFEPNPATVERLRRNVELNNFSNVDIVPKAVAQHAGVTEFHLATEPGLSTISLVSHITLVEKITVETISLDDYVAQRNWPRVDVMKIDVEGHDCQAILGARDIITQFKPVIAFEFVYSTDPEIAAAAFDLLAQNGYTLRRVIYRSGLTLGKLVEFDWKHQADQEISIDVICFPPSKSASG